MSVSKESRSLSVRLDDDDDDDDGLFRGKYWLVLSRDYYRIDSKYHPAIVSSWSKIRYFIGIYDIHIKICIILPIVEILFSFI